MNPMANRDLCRSMSKHGLMLGLFALVAALITTLVHDLTRDEILFQRQQAQRQALAQVFPAGLHDNDLLDDGFPLNGAVGFEDLALLALDEPATGYTARLGGRVTGVILPARVPDGYGGDIDILVGVRHGGVVAGVRVLSHRETPGLGDKIDLDVADWILGFNGRSLGEPPENRWRVRKDGGDFDQFTGATVTPRAVVNGVRKTLVFFRENQTRLLEER